MSFGINSSCRYSKHRITRDSRIEKAWIRNMVITVDKLASECYYLAY